MPMIRSVRSALVTVAAAAALGASLVPAAAATRNDASNAGESTNGYSYYRFDIRPLYRPGIVPIPTGDFELRFDPKGYVNGYFRAYESGRFVPVIGSINGATINLQIGLGAGFLNELNGRLNGKQIDGTGYFEGGNYVFRAVPEDSLGV